MGETLSLPKIPRCRENDYSEEVVKKRQQLAEQTAKQPLPYLCGESVPYAETRNNIENLIGYAQVPVGIAGPFRLNTTKGEREIYVPMATTEGAMIASFSRGMHLLNRGEGARARVVREGLTQCPMLVYDSVAAAQAAAELAEASFAEFSKITEQNTRHGKLLEVKTNLLGKRLVVALLFHTGDAIGINMVSKVAEACSKMLAEKTGALERYVHGQDFEKRSSYRSIIEGRGRSIVADAVVPKDALIEVTRATPEQLVKIHRSYSAGFSHMGAQNWAVHSANTVAGIFIACGQDAAYAVESANGFIDFDITERGDLYLSVYMPSLLVGTVGGGSAQGTARECLQILGCFGAGHANTLAEIIAATVLAGDLSLMAAFCTHEFVGAHEKLGRNRP